MSTPIVPMKWLLQNLRDVLQNPSIAGQEIIARDNDGNLVEMELGELLEEALRVLDEETSE
jgi:hypothetical protein